MSELEQPPAGGVSRRTVTKAMAWSVPVIAVAATAPMAAASVIPLSVSGLGCKLPGNSNSLYKGYAFRLSADNSGNNVDVTINIQTITLNGTLLSGPIVSGSATGVAILNLDNSAFKVNPFTAQAGVSYPHLVLLTEFASNSSNGTLVIKYYSSTDPSNLKTITASVGAAPPIQGNSCPTSTFSASDKLKIENTLGLNNPPAWQANTAYNVGDTVTLGAGVVEATVAGTSGASAPALPASVGGTVTDGPTLVWTRTA